MPRGPVRAVALAVLFHTVLLLIPLGIVPGWITFEVGSRTITLLSGILAVKLLVQFYFAEKNNRRMKEIVRGSMLQAMLPDSPTARKYWRKRFRQRYPEWRKSLRRRYPHLRSRKAWVTAVNAMVTSVAAGRPLPVVGVEIPIHGLSLRDVKRTVASIRNQSFRVSHIVLSVNGHHGDPIEEKIRKWVASLKDERIKVIYLEEGHKRSAMAAAFRRLDELGCNHTINVDGDTVLDFDAILIGVLVKLLLPRAHAITSNVEIENHRRDSLSYQTWLRYLYANHVERAAESWFFCVACMSGPYMQCETGHIREILATRSEWEFQEFRGQRVGPGDDRMLTQRLLARGYGTVFVPDIHTLTECPDSIPKWKRQQLRWSRSGLRAYWIEWNKMWFWQNFSQLTILGEFYLAWFSFFITMVVLTVLGNTVIQVLQVGLSGGLDYILPYAIAVLVVNGGKAVAFALLMRDWRMVGILGYNYYLIRYLVVIKYRALWTLNNSDWGTRSSAPQS